MRRTLLAIALLLSSAPLAAYTIFLKDGSSLEAREKYTVRGALAIIVLPSGAETTLPLAQIDVARTNSGNFGSATVLSGSAATPPPAAPASTGSSLGALAKERGMPPVPTRATPPPAPHPVDNKSGEGRTNTGAPDLMREPRVPVSDLTLASTVAELLRAHGLARAAIFQGTAPRRLLVEVSANSEGGVFQAIGATAQAILEVEGKKPGAVEALELFVATDRRQRAGQFLITRENAQELVGKQLDLTAFYLKYVEF